MKSLLGEERSFIIESDDDEEDPAHNDAGLEEDEDGSSSSSCATPRAGGGDGSHPNSYTNQWPQSYRCNRDRPYVRAKLLWMNSLMQLSRRQEERN